VVHQPGAGVLLAENLDSFFELTYEKLVLATGAREKFLPFPGWTLPNVMGAGGLQAMVKSGLPIRGKRVLVAGTGPLLLAVAAYLRKHGAEIPVICEQASWKSLAKFGLTLFSWPQKIIQGFQLKRDLAGVSFAANSWPLAAHGQKTLESVTISRAGKNQNIPCDYLACGFHLVPNIELPLLLGCAVDNGCVQVDDLQTTTVPSVFCAGEPTSVGGVELALIEGQVAGLAAAGHASGARKLFGKRQKARRFARLLDRTFRLRSELRSLSLPDTIVCRCEDVSYSRLRQHRSWRAAKLHTRCGMGPCQGRVCGPATQFLFNWNPDSVRPPVFPARVETLAAVTAQSQLQHSEVTGGRS
jgi:NADPH-dependent 2,4-dienoyl-CoA reductase/sulfur reductase-like enzyme